MNWSSEPNAKLLDALMVLRSRSDARAFLRDLMTENEIEEFGKRFLTARMLSDAIPYTDIQNATGFSSTTVARVSKWLQTGAGGYRTVINRLHHPAVSSGRGLR
ncbi:MAG: hypothetical protein KBD06_00720 [Candidatus Pacebacteria bacterium]|nr:hypothetical protein [Candidatus Paceibacterota bacterium]